MNAKPILTRISTSLHKSLRVGAGRDWKLMLALCLVTAIGFLAYITRLSDISHDLFHEMALARAWLTTGHFPVNDVFAYTPTVSPAVHHEWATGLVGYLISAVNPLGVIGLTVFKLLLVVGLGITLYRVARNNGANPIVFAVITPLVFPLAWIGFATIRAQMFTLAALALTMLALQSDWRGRRVWVLGWSVLYVAWLNLHAGFVVGVGMVAFHALERVVDSVAVQYANYKKQPTSATGFLAITLYQTFLKTWHLILLIPMMALGALINPWTWEYIPYLVRAISMPRPMIIEWRPLWYAYDTWCTLFVFSTAVFMMGYVAVHRDWRRLRGWVFCAIAAYMALKHMRHGSLFAIVWIAYMPGWLTHTPLGKLIINFVQSTRTYSIELSKILIGVYGAFVLAYPIWMPTFPTDIDPRTMNYPLGVVDYLEKNQVRGNVMGPFHCGAYVSWKLYPNIKVSLDGRYEVAYQPGVFEDHLDFYNDAKGSELILDKYGHDYIIVPINSAIASRFDRSNSEYLEGSDEKMVAKDDCFAKWHTVYRDDQYLLVKRSEKTF